MIAKYTYVGDANLDGQVDALDYEQVDLNIGNGVGSPFGSVFIPEPGVLAPLAIVVAGLSFRRRS
jgi:hypothetical protein